jgi:hypothetical protein
MCQFDGEILTSRPQCQSLKKADCSQGFFGVAGRLLNRFDLSGGIGQTGGRV